MAHIPEIRDLNGIPTLFVHDKPFFALGGELHNSSASSLEYMEKNVWPNLEGLNMNTVILPLYWECIEPVEGIFDFTLMDGIIAQARARNMHLVFLWFGLWKNAESMYIPGWMKRDSKTYFRVRKVNGEPINTVSPLCAAAVEKDVNAFTHIMAHLKEIDSEENTVLFMQVENEIGVLGTERDYGEEANALFEAPVPEKLAQGLNVQGTWREAFGEAAEESFMAWHFGCAVEKITAAGRAQYPIPCYANCWLRQYPWYTGSYPAGGPVKTMHPIWKIAAPSLFTFGPDIYVSYVAQILDEYAYEGNPLVIPEVRKDAVTASYCLYAFGQHNAICYSPFGIEEITLPQEMIDVPPMEVMMALNIDPSAFDMTGSAGHLRDAYGMVKEMEPLYLQYRGTEKLKTWLRKSEIDYGTFLHTENYDLAVSYDPRISGKPLPVGLLYELTPDQFLVIGMRSGLTFRAKPGENVKIDILSLQEGTVKAGEFVPGRILNGDEKMSLHLGDNLTCLMVELFKY